MTISKTARTEGITYVYRLLSNLLVQRSDHFFTASIRMKALLFSFALLLSFSNGEAKDRSLIRGGGSNGKKKGKTPQPAPAAATIPVSTPAPVTPFPSAASVHCGCDTCTDAIWNADAAGFTCGARILWVLGSNPEAYPNEQAACARVAGLEFPTVCGPACDPARCSISPTPPTPVPTPSPTTTTTTHCGCPSCTTEIWNAMADGFTCGARVTWLTENYPQAYPTESSACATVAGVEFPSVCGPACDPAQCTATTTTSTTTTPQPTMAPMTPSASITTPAPSLQQDTTASAGPTTQELYCYPPYADRTRYTNVWSKYTVEVKESSALCGPGNNLFSTNTVALNSGDALTMSYKKVGSNWEASEVRVLLPDSAAKFTYGTYSFSVSSVSVIDTTDSSIVSKILPENLVLGLFTWDDTERYDIHENMNHEVDIEISRWSNASDADIQFLVQPVEAPSRYRFYSGADHSSLDPGGHTYAFTWNPGQIDWTSTAGGGQTHMYATQTSILNGVQDYVQCLPANMEVRINLWNSNGPVAPSGLGDNFKVEVTIDNFTYTPSGLAFVPNGGYCSKDCMCAATSSCVSGKCVAS